MRPPEKQLKDAQECIARGGGALDTLPVVISSIIKNESWRHLLNKDGKPFASFPEFVEYKLWWGLETKYTRLIEFCKDNAECHRLLLEQVPAARPSRKKGAELSGDNVTRSHRGNSQEHTLKRLKRDCPELADKVIAGELSAHAAAVQAGFRKPSITLQANDPQRAAQRIRDVLGRDFANQLGTLLVSQ